MAIGIDAREEIDGLRKAADEAARTVRIAYVAFLSIGAYIAVVIAGTTDKQLLLVAPVTMPILNVDIPVTGFYTAVPWLFVILHLNLLMQLYLLSCKLHRLREAIEAGVARTSAVHDELSRLFPFLFSEMLVTPHPQRSIRVLLHFIVIVSTVLLPLVLVLWAQIRFLPYHDATLTFLQRGAVVIDAGLIVYFWPRIGARDGGWHLWRPWNAWGGLAQPLWSLTVVAFAGVVALLSVIVAEVPDGPVERALRTFWPIDNREGCPTKVCFGPTYHAFRWIEANDWPFDRNLDLANENLVESALSTGVIRQLREGTVAERRIALKTVAGLNLDGRDLRFADFENALLPNASLRGASVEGATLFRALWPGADLRALHVPGSTQCLPGTDAWRPDGDSDVLKRVDYRGSDPESEKWTEPEVFFDDLGLTTRFTNGLACIMRLADAKGEKGAVLAQINLMDARLLSQTLDHANLLNASLYGANLSGARLHGANLSGAQLHGADLIGAELHGANLFGANLHGADLRWAELYGADLRVAELQGANLARAELHGADLFGAQLHGADLSGAQLYGADLSGAQLHGANLSGANLYGARIDKAVLDLAVLRNIRRGRLNAETVAEIETGLRSAGLGEETIERTMARLRKRVGEPDMLGRASRERARYCEPMRSNPHTDCLYDYPLARYGPEVVAEVLAPLACAADAKTGVAEMIARRAGSFFGPSDIAPWLVPALLDEQCIGARTLSDDMRALLELLKRKLQAQGGRVE